MEILDCTLRDGGYLTKWFFDKPIVKQYLSIIDKYVDYVELGYRSPYEKCLPVPGFGHFKCCNEKTLIGGYGVLPNEKQIIMIDFKDYCLGGEFSKSKFDTFIGEQIHSLFSIIRIAINYDEIQEFIKAVGYVKSKGWTVFVSLMKISNFESTGIECQITEQAEKLFFADSFGSCCGIELNYEIINRYVEFDFYDALYTTDNLNLSRIGFHLHNNTNNAMDLATSLYSQTRLNNIPITIDTTVCGYGRGAGNVDLFEFLLKTKFDVRKPEDYLPLLEFSLKFAYWMDNRSEEYEKKYLYMIGAMLNLHPNIVTHEINERYGVELKVNTLIEESNKCRQ